MNNNITYWLKQLILLALILVQVGNAYSAPKVLARTEITSPESAQGLEIVNSWRVLESLGSKFKLDVPALTKLVDDMKVNPNLDEFLRNNPQTLDAWELIYKSPYSHDVKILTYVDDLKDGARVGSSNSLDYRKTFFDAFPDQTFQGNGFVVHHAIEQQILTKYKGLFTEAEINSLQSLRGISPEINPQMHLSNIRNEWNKFYNQFPDGVSPTRQQVLDKVSEIDNLFGSLFSPPIRPL